MSKGIFETLVKKYPADQFCVMKEVSNEAGHRRSRSADYMVMGLWPSRGCHLQGIELKSRRGDWLKELKNPEKAESIFKYCDFWWLLTSDDDVAKIEEIPHNWGWMSIKNGRVLIIKEAPKLIPVPVTRSFLAALLKRAGSKDGYIMRGDIQEEIKRSFEQGVESEKKQNTRKERELESLRKLRDGLSDFERETGVPVSRMISGNYYLPVGFENEDLKKIFKIYQEARTVELIVKRLEFIQTEVQKLNVMSQRTLSDSKEILSKII